MAEQLNLQANEVVLLRASGVQIGERQVFNSHDLVLTNLHLVAIKKGAMGGVKGRATYPLSQIKVYNGRVQALATSVSGHSNVLEVFFLDRHVQFIFFSNEKPNAREWSRTIHEAVTGERLPLETDSRLGGTVPSLDQISNAFKGAIGQLRSPKSALTTATPPPPPPMVIAAKCSGCGAPLSGMQGAHVVCDYCLLNQAL